MLAVCSSYSALNCPLPGDDSRSAPSVMEVPRSVDVIKNLAFNLTPDFAKSI